MLINRVIWQRALQSNNKYTLFLLIVCLVSLYANLLYAQDLPAVLEKGPYEVVGIDVLEPNAIKAHEGIYLVAEQKLVVLYTQSEIIISFDLIEEISYCLNKQIFSLTFSSVLGKVYYYHDPTGFSLFFIFPKGFENVCIFINQFIDQFFYFLRFRVKERDIPFPAIVALNSP